MKYEVMVPNGETVYYGANNYETSAPAKYEVLGISETFNSQQFKNDLLVHQQGKTHYMPFC